MGAQVSAEVSPELVRGRLDPSFSADLSLLSGFVESSLFTPWLLSNYASLPPDPALTHFTQKWSRMQTKLDDITHVLSITSSAEFTRKHRKYLARHAGMSSVCFNKHRDVMRSRQRFFAALYVSVARMQAREVKYGVVPKSSTVENREMLRDILDHLDDDFVEEIEALAWTLGNTKRLYSVVGLASIPSRDGDPVHVEEKNPFEPLQALVEQEEADVTAARALQDQIRRALGLPEQVLDSPEIEELDEADDDAITIVDDDENSYDEVQDMEDMQDIASDDYEEDENTVLFDEAILQDFIQARTLLSDPDTAVLDSQRLLGELGLPLSLGISSSEEIPEVQGPRLPSGRVRAQASSRSWANRVQGPPREDYRTTIRERFPGETLGDVSSSKQRFRAFEMLRLCVKKSVELSSQDSPEAVQEVTRLAGFLQRDLLCCLGDICMSGSTEDISEFVPKVSSYVDFVLKEFSFFIESNSDSEFSVESPIHSLLPSLILGLSLVLDSPALSGICAAILRPLSALVTVLDCRAATPTASTLPNAPSFKLVESLHSYAPGVSHSSHINFPGASHLVLKFDPQCHTERGLDTLEVLDCNGVSLLPEPLHGIPKNWPTSQVILPGDQLEFKFTSMSRASHWGYRCTVSAVFLSVHDVLTDLLLSSSMLLGKCIRVSLSGQELTLLERTCLPQLDGLPCLLESSHKPWGPLPSLSKLNSLVNLPSHPTDSLGGDVLSQTNDLCLSAMLKHSGLWKTSDQDPVVSNIELLTQIFSAGKKIRQWVVSERQRMMLESDSVSYEDVCRGINSKAGLLLSHSGEVVPTSTLVEFFTGDPSANDIAATIGQQKERVDTVLSTLESFYGVLMATQSEYILMGVLSPDVFRPRQDFWSKLPGISVKSKESIMHVLTLVSERLVHVATEHNNPSIRCLAGNFLAMPSTPTPILESLATFKGSSLPSSFSSTLSKYITAVLLGSSFPSPVVLESLFETLLTAHSSYIAAISSSGSRFALEESCFTALTSFTPYLNIFHENSRLCSLAFSLLQFGSFRIQRIAVRLLAHTLPNLSPESFLSLPLIESRLPSILVPRLTSLTPLSYLFCMIGACSLPPQSSTIDTSDYRDGSTSACLALELLRLLRGLLRCALWKPRIQQLVLSGLKDLAPKSGVPVVSSLSAVLLCGGESQRLRVGSTIHTVSGTEAVILQATRESGVVIAIHENSAKVLLSNGTFLEAELDKLCSAQWDGTGLLDSAEVASECLRMLLGALRMLTEAHSSTVYACVLSSRILTAVLYFTTTCKGSTSILLDSGLMDQLATLACSPTGLIEFQSLEQLSRAEQYLMDKLLESRSGFRTPPEYVKSTQQQLLPYSPYCNERVLLPSSMDPGSSIGSITFTDSLCTSLHLGPVPPLSTTQLDSSDPQNPVDILNSTDLNNDATMMNINATSPEEIHAGATRSAQLIPNHLPGFYFEMTIGSCMPTGSFCVAMGLHREGLPLSAAPGSGSYAYSGGNGEIHSSDGITPYGVPYGTGDTIGCGLDFSSSSMYFTVNGTRLPTAFSGLSGRFYPAIWLQVPDSSVSLNFGQQVFFFDYLSTLPDRFSGGESAPRRDSHVSEAVIRRETEALTLKSLYPDFPVELCVIALENNNDNLMVAANWLIEHGWQELERLTEDIIAKSMMEADAIPPELLYAEEVVKEEAKDESDSEDLIAWLDNSVRNSGDSGPGVLDDELEVDIPVGIEPLEITRRVPGRVAPPTEIAVDVIPVVSPIPFDEIKPGLPVCISRLAQSLVNWDTRLDCVLGKTGTVYSVDVNTRQATIRVFLQQRSVLISVCVPLLVLHKPAKTTNWRAPEIEDCLDNMDGAIDTADLSSPDKPTDVSNFSLDDSKQSDRKCTDEQYAQLEHQLRVLHHVAAVARVRNIVYELVSRWPTAIPFSLEYFGGISTTLSLLKLAGAQFLSCGSTQSKHLQSDQAAHTPLSTFRSHLSVLLPTSKTLPSLLVESCISHIHNSITNPPPSVVFETSHPYLPHTEMESRIHIQGASRLLVTFDPKTKWSSDVLTKLVFYRDELLTDQIISLKTGRDSFVVPANTVWVRFQGSGDCDYWGIKITVRPIELRWNDRQALQGMNFEFASWLFTFIMDEFPIPELQNHTGELFNVLSKCVMESKSSGKQRVVDMLIRVLIFLQTEKSKTTPRFEQLDTLRALIDAMLDTSGDSETLMQSSLLQSVIELLATAGLVKHSLRVDEARDTVVSVELEGLSTLSSNPKTSAVSTLQSIDDTTSTHSEGMSTLEASEDTVVTQSGDFTENSISSSIPESNGSSALQTFGDTLVAQTDELICQSISTVQQSQLTTLRDDLEGFGGLRLVVTRALYGEPSSGDPGYFRDVTLEAIALASSFGNALLMIPRNLTQWNGVLDVSQDHLPLSELPQRRKKLHLSFDLVLITRNTSQVLKSMERVLINDTIMYDLSQTSSYTVLRAAPSLFDRIEDMSKLISCFTDNYNVPPSLSTAAQNVSTFLRTALVVLSYFAGGSLAIPDPLGPDRSTPKFTLGFRIRLPTENTSHEPLNIVRKGLLSQSYPAVFLEPTSTKINVQISTESGASCSVVSVHSLPVDKWIHIAVVCSGSHLHLFINGQEDRCVPLHADIGLPNADPFLIGDLPFLSHNTNGFIGQLIDLRYSLAPASAEEIAGIVASLPDPETGIVSTLPPSPLESTLDSAEQESIVIPTDMDHIAAGVILMHPIPDLDLQPTVEMPESGSQAAVEPLESDIQSTVKADYPDIQETIGDFHTFMYSTEIDCDIASFFTALEESHIQKRKLSRRSNLLHMNPYAYSSSYAAPTLQTFPLLLPIPYSDLCHRLILLQVLNERVRAILPSIDFSTASVHWSLAYRLSLLRGRIFLQVKMEPWNEVLRDTSRGQRQSVVVSRPKALLARERGDPDGKRSVFGQIYRQLHFNRPAYLRMHERPWSVNFAGEGGTDVGGLFRDSMSEICAELQGPAVPLFIQCPNSSGFGENQDKFIPNPRCTSALHLSMYKFIGKLMGVSIRGSHMLNLDFPSMLWKPLVGDRPTREDLRGIDAPCFDLLEKLSLEISVEESIALEKSIALQKSVSLEIFNSDDEKCLSENGVELVAYTFSTMSTDGRLIDLKDGGRDIAVTSENTAEYLALLENYRMHEFDVQVEAIRRGLATIVPVQLLPLFSWEDLELMVCGKKSIDIEYLKANTVFQHNIRSTDPHVLLFWEVLEEFGHAERQKFLRFVWGQSRLPYNPDDFRDKFKIGQALRDSDQALPVSRKFVYFYLYLTHCFRHLFLLD